MEHTGSPRVYPQFGVGVGVGNKQSLHHRKIVSCLAHLKLSHPLWMWRPLSSLRKQVHLAIAGLSGQSSRSDSSRPIVGTGPEFLRVNGHGMTRSILTFFFSPSPRNFSITYITMTTKSQSHLFPSQPWAFSGIFCLIRKCPPQGTFPGLSLVFSLSEENIKA